MQGSIRLGQVAGIPISINYTWLVAFFLIAWTLAVGYFPANLPDQPVLTYWIIGAVAAILLFASVLLHELSHSLVALRLGLSVRGITLFIFGGISQISGEAEEPRHEFLIAAVGPAVSLGLAGAFWLVNFLWGQPESAFWLIIGYLALINLLLGIFNLLPGFPLDGGRVLRSIIWGATDNLVKATNIAAVAGQILGWLLIGWGIFQLFTGNFIGGIWITLIGWFLNNGAEVSRRETILKEEFRDVPVTRLLRPDPPMIPPTTSVSDLVHRYIVQEGRRALPVEEQGDLVGIVSITDAKKVPQEAWGRTPVGTIMTRDSLATISTDSNLAEALQLLGDRDVNQLLVLRDGRLAGLLSRADLVRFIQTREELGLRSSQTPTRGQRSTRPEADDRAA